MSAVLGGHADFGVVTFSVALPLLAAGKVRVLSIVTQDKMPGYPDLPNLFELGYNTGIRQFYLAAFAPKGTPDAIVKKLEKAIEQVTNGRQLQSEDEQHEPAHHLQNRRPVGHPGPGDEEDLSRSG